MAEELVMPRLSDTMESGTVARWVLHEGDQVHAGDVVAEIETDKATMEYQSDVEGVLLRILVGDGESAALGAPIALVGEAGEEVAGDGDGGGASGEAAAEAPAGDGDGAPAAERREAPAPASQRDGAPRPAGGPLKASPIARRMAEEAGVELRDLAGRGSGPDGRIVRVDVERLIERRDRRDDLPKTPTAARATAAPAVQPRAEAEEEKLTTMQRAVARRMAESKATVPHFYLEVEVDMGRATSFRAELNAALSDVGEKVSVNDFIIRACALALVDNRQFHRSFAGDRMVYHPHADIGVAVALDDGLVVPVVRAAETKSLREIAREARDLASRARSGQIKQPEIENATFTISNLGMFGVSRFAAIINPPEPGILAVGATVEKPVVRDGEVVVRPIMGMTLSVDHRATSGADGARFLQSVRRYLESPVLLGA
jgi:pyruvate dehydrogenase E2 component (dihydrolipoamide acetyltransferase)